MSKGGAPKGNTNAKKYKDKEKLKKLIDAYFVDCDERNAPYTMSGLAYALNIDRDTLVNYGKDELFSDLIKNAKARVQRQLEENGLSGKGNSTFTIFNLKNNYGWKDQQEVKKTSDIEDLTTLADMLGFGKK
jgi:hypothetical protein